MISMDQINPRKAKNLTNTPIIEHGISLSPDGKMVLFSASIDGQEDLYLLKPGDKEHPTLETAHQFRTERITNTNLEKKAAMFSPNGKWISYIGDGKLYLCSIDGKTNKILVDQSQVIDYDWSPDSNWLVFARSDASFASELYAIPANGQAKPVNISRYATYNSDVSWSKDGKTISFIRERNGERCVFVMSVPASKKNVFSAPTIPWEGAYQTAKQLALQNASEVSISPRGTLVAFVSNFGGSRDLWVVSQNGSGLRKITTNNANPHQLHWSRTGGTIYFLDRSNTIKSVNIVDSDFSFLNSSSSQRPIDFVAKMDIDIKEEYFQMFDQCWQNIATSFYDPQYHGVPWKDIRNKYRPVVAHIVMKEDLFGFISLMVGELNASHLGIMGRTAAKVDPTAQLGIVFDSEILPEGKRIKEIIPLSPASRLGFALKVGDVVTSIDRVSITPKTNISKLLNGKVREIISLELYSPKSKSAVEAQSKPEKRRVELIGAPLEVIAECRYRQWVSHNEQLVANGSHNKLGYIHIPSMDDKGLEIFVRSLYSDHFDKEGLVLDVRFNGGGFTHDRVMNYLGSEPHTYFRQRNGNEGFVLRASDRKWTKPVILLINNQSYSDAEILPNAFRSRGLGKIVGVPTGGLVIGTVSTTLIDGSSFRVPRLGVWTAKGINMEKQGVAPDVQIEMTPEDLSNGKDPQILKSLELLSEDVVIWKKNHSIPNRQNLVNPNPTTTGINGPATNKPK